MFEIKKYLHSGSKIQHLSQIKGIFLESTELVLSTEEEKNEAFKKWTEYYIETHPEWIYLALENNIVKAYILVCPDSEKALNLKKVFRSYELFSDQFSDFPAHIHINASTRFRGQGLGSTLIEAVCTELEKEHKNGIHIVTRPDSDNVQFYQKLGFSHQVQRSFDDFRLLFMGKTLT